MFTANGVPSSMWMWARLSATGLRPSASTSARSNPSERIGPLGSHRPEEYLGIHPSWVATTANR